MKLSLQEQVIRINNIDKNDKTFILIKAIESLLNINKVVNVVLNKYTTQNKVINNYIKTIGLEIIDEFRNYDNYVFFEKELKKYCGFLEEDEVSSDIIFQCSIDGKVDIVKLKKELIGAANFIHNESEDI